MSRTSGKRQIARKVAIVATALGLWGALVLLFAAPLALMGPVSWREAVSFGGSFWALWLLFLPVVAWLSFRFPIERKKLLRNLGFHLLACLLIVGAGRVSSRAITGAFPRPQLSQAPGTPPGERIVEPRLQNQGRRRPPPPPRSPGSKATTHGAPGAFGVFLGLRAGLDVLVYWSLVGVCQAIINFRKSQERERRAAELEARLTTARLQALRMQINPHFLFNTLNSIAALVYVNPRAADEMLGDLSELLRRSLDSMEEQEIPLAQELEFITGYLRIEQKRFGERLRVEQSIPDELMNALVPALILQPLVENAIRHGIEPRLGPGHISIEAKQEDKHLHLIIRDNGSGLSGAEPTEVEKSLTAALAVPFRASESEQQPATASQVGEAAGKTLVQPFSNESRLSRPSGIGLINIQSRLQVLYGHDQSFSIRKERHGCQVDIRLPFHREALHPDLPKEARVPGALNEGNWP